ncbi:hypothetical protein HV192_16140 [Klebsiella oxytoca]|uniref:hypothetical protein n=1 Tax=Klebsiella grimontii TaxID=2058152 RepID=UPI0015EA21B6|nr:hypothetical protein [Klebsiella grimontii]EGT0065418.1 ABC transporter substrate-binding protein [Klebsiella michiganensis]QLU22374.1 hypothetical protein HV192_16140 [Klebsiella oxytoca]WDI68104.1 hypothetical protein PU992_17205 [Klebsiella grimontii]
MNVYEMEGVLRGKCLPGDIKVNESNAEYLVRKLNAASELQGELTAALATIEKCREIVGCQADVDLQDWVKQLAAENLTMLRLLTDISENHVEYFSEGEDGMFAGVPLDYVSEINMYVSRDVNAENPFPATDHIVAAAEARGVEKFAAEQRGVAERLQKRSVAVAAHSISFCLDSAEEAEDFARRLRKGAK